MIRFTLRRHGQEAANFRLAVTLTRSDYERVKEQARAEGQTVREWLNSAAADGVFRHLGLTGDEDEETAA